MVFSQSVSPGQARGWINEHKFQHKESVEKKNSHSISSSIQSVYIVYMFTSGPW